MAAFDEMKGWLKEAQEAQPIELTSCPVCGWSLSKNKTTGGLHCPFCGWPVNNETAMA